MAEQLRRNAGGSQPISQHPLFPAIVALWFGALFGLGSMVIRPAVIEHAVLAIGLDTIVPMAAPPLGTTTRILIALVMTGLGGVIGALIARRVARPAPEVHERRRGAVAMGGSAVFPEDEPVAAEVTTAPARSANTPMAPGRRRSLTMLETAPADDADDGAAFPSHPSSILNVAEFDLDGFEQGDAPDFRDTGFGVRLGAGIAAGIEAEDLPVIGAAQARGETVEHAPDAGPYASTDKVAPVLGNRLFESYSREISTRISAPSLAPAPAATVAPTIDPTPEPGFTLMPRLNVAGWSHDQGDAHDSDENRDADGIYAAAPVKPLFERSAPSAHLTAAPETPAFAATEPVMTQDDMAPDNEPHWDQAPVDDAFNADADDRAIAAVPSGIERPSAAQRIVAAELDELSPVELLERLALAMARRREEARLAAAAPVMPTVAAVASPAAPPFASPILASVATGMRASAETDALPERPTPFEAPVAAAVEAPAFEAPASVVRALGFEPLAFRPVGLDETPIGNSWEPEPEADTPVPAASPATLGHIPAALRPVGFEAYADDEEDDALPGYLPPRHIGMAQDSTDGIGGGTLAFEDTGYEFDADCEDDAGYEDDAPHEDEDGEETLVLEQGYSSLLDLSRPAATRQPFVRIDEPEEAGEIQPVVIFPGEETRETGPFARPVPASVAQGQQPSALPPFPPTPFAPAPSPLAGERMFDAPGRNDPAETERALRAALATLQRMSGAA